MRQREKLVGQSGRGRHGRIADRIGLRSRALATALEPVVGSVYFAPEAHAAYAALGFGPSPGPITDGEWARGPLGKVMMTDGVTYFASRGGLLGQVRGTVVAAAFGVFNPASRAGGRPTAWQVADADTMVAAAHRGAVAQLARILGAAPDGSTGRSSSSACRRAADGARPADVRRRRSRTPMPAEPLGRMWHLGDQLREFRGDAHIAAFPAAGFDGCQFQVLTERCAGMPPRTYAAGGWDPDQFDAAERRLVDARPPRRDDAVTAAGRAAREAVEPRPIALCVPMVEALGDDVIELVGHPPAVGRCDPRRRRLLPVVAPAGARSTLPSNDWMRAERPARPFAVDPEGTPAMTDVFADGAAASAS